MALRVITVAAADLGPEVGGLVVEHGGRTILLLDPRLPRRRQIQIICDLLTDGELDEVSPLEIATA